MKKTILSFMLLIFTLGAFAQNASMQKTAKAVFTLTTFNKDGSLKASSHGIFVSADGQAVSTLQRSRPRHCHRCARQTTHCRNHHRRKRTL